MTDNHQSDKTSRKKAVALSYQQNDAPPRVAAKGAGYLAEKIINLARKHNVPIHQDQNLTEILAALEPEQEIPPSAFIAVAEILTFIYQANSSFEPDKPQS